MLLDIRNYAPAFGEAIEALQRKYIAAHPKGARFVSRDFYWDHPALERGENVFCVFERDELTGYGVLIPSPAKIDSETDIPNKIWIYIRVDPESRDINEIQEILYQRILEKSLQYSQRWKGRRTRMAISYPETRQEEILFFRQKGLTYFDALLQMNRDLSVPLPRFVLPDGVVLRRWPMETRKEKQQYISAEAVVFPHSPRSVDEIEFYIGSWAGGTPVTAFDREGGIVGSMMAYWYGVRNGVTEDIFVMPGWRRRGIARCLLAEGINYLVENGVACAWLEVKESNTSAVRLYESLGYLVANRDEQLGMDI